MTRIRMTSCVCRGGVCHCDSTPFNPVAAAGVPKRTTDLLAKYGLEPPPAGKRYPAASLDEHLKSVPLQERLLVKAELSQRGWL